jgi:hypothetical protein
VATAPHFCVKGFSRAQEPNPAIRAAIIGYLATLKAQ